jgi:hypothetical protein
LLCIDTYWGTLMAMDKKREDEWLASILKDDYQDILNPCI